MSIEVNFNEKENCKLKLSIRYVSKSKILLKVIGT